MYRNYSVKQYSGTVYNRPILAALAAFCGCSPNRFDCLKFELFSYKTKKGDILLIEIMIILPSKKFLMSVKRKAI